MASFRMIQVPYSTVYGNITSIDFVHTKPLPKNTVRDVILAGKASPCLGAPIRERPQAEARLVEYSYVLRQ